MFIVKKSVADDMNDKMKLEQLKKEIIKILTKKENQDEEIEKAVYGVGTVRVWKGKKYKKVSASPVKWVRVYDKHTRGASQSMGRYIAQVKRCNSVEELYQFCMKQKSLFQDENGVDLPIMDKLRAAIDEQGGKIERGEVNTVKGKYKTGDIVTVDVPFMEGDYKVMETYHIPGGNMVKLENLKTKEIKRVSETFVIGKNKETDSEKEKFKNDLVNEIMSEKNPYIYDKTPFNEKEFFERLKKQKTLYTQSGEDFSKDGILDMVDMAYSLVALDYDFVKDEKDRNRYIRNGVKSRVLPLVASEKNLEILKNYVRNNKYDADLEARLRKQNLYDIFKDVYEGSSDSESKSTQKVNAEKKEPVKFWNGKVESEVGEGDFVAEMKGVGGGLYRNRFKTKAEAEKSTKNHQALGFESHVVEDKKEHTITTNMGYKKKEDDNIKGQPGAVAMLKNQMETWNKDKLNDYLNERLEKLNSGKVTNISVQNVRNQIVAARELLKEKFGDTEKPIKDKLYWIKDKGNNRITSEDAKNRIKSNLSQIDAYNNLIENSDKADAIKWNSKKNQLEDDNIYLMDRLNPDDRSEMESEAEKHQNRSNAMKGNQNAYKGGSKEETLTAKEIEFNKKALQEIKKYESSYESVQNDNILNYLGKNGFNKDLIKKIINKYGIDKSEVEDKLRYYESKLPGLRRKWENDYSGNQSITREYQDAQKMIVELPKMIELWDDYKISAEEKSRKYNFSRGSKFDVTRNIVHPISVEKNGKVYKYDEEKTVDLNDRNTLVYSTSNGKDIEVKRSELIKNPDFINILNEKRKKFENRPEEWKDNILDYRAYGKAQYNRKLTDEEYLRYSLQEPLKYANQKSAAANKDGIQTIKDLNKELGLSIPEDGSFSPYGDKMDKLVKEVKTAIDKKIYKETEPKKDISIKKSIDGEIFFESSLDSYLRKSIENLKSYLIK